MVFTDARDPGHPIIFANRSFLALTGYSREETLPQRFIFLMAGETKPEALAAIEAAFNGEVSPDTEICCCRKDGSAIWVALYVSPVRDGNGDVVQHFASLADLSSRRREKNRLQVLLDELNHRTQNMLVTVQGIAAQTLRGRASADVVGAFEGRILALSNPYALLAHENWDRLDLRDVIGRVLKPFGLDDHHHARFSGVMWQPPPRRDGHGTGS